MQRKILILGAGVYQVPLIQRARSMGLTTVVVSIAGKYPGIPLADVFVPLDTTDIDGIVRAAREHQVNGVATTGTDVCVPALGAVTDALKLAGPGYEAARRSMFKTLMKEAFVLHGVPTAEFGIFSASADAKQFAGKIGYPVMVKATDSSGSRGVTRVDAPAGFDPAWAVAMGVSHNKQIIVERCLVGQEFGAQALVQGDRVVAVFTHGDTVTPPPFNSPLGHWMPSGLPDAVEQATRTSVEQAVAALGIRDAVCNVDFMLVGDQVMVLEIGARMGATCLPENIGLYAGFDLYEYILRVALGERPEVTIRGRQPNASLLLQSPANGILTSVAVPSSVRTDPNVVSWQVDVQPGDPVRRFQVGPDRIGHLVVKGDTAEKARALVEVLSAQFWIDVCTKN